MRLSTKGRYAVTAMLDLALNGTEGPVTLADISENQGISLSYLEQLFAALRSKVLCAVYEDRVVVTTSGVNRTRFRLPTLSVRSTNGLSSPAARASRTVTTVSAA